MTEPNRSEAVLANPLSVQQIVEKAQNFDYNPLIPLKYWLRSASTLLQEAAIYEREGNDQQTYLLLFRHAQLVLGSLRAHPDARQAQNRPNLVQAERAVQNNLAKLEILRPRIKKRYERYEQLLRDRDARNASRNASGNPNKYTPNILPSDPALSGTEALGAGDNKDLAVKLAHKEIRRRANAKTASRQAKILEKGQEKKTGGPRGTIEDGLPKNSQSFDGDTLSQQMQNLRSQVSYQANGHTQERPSFERPKLIYQYPTVPEQRSSKSNFSAVSTLKDSPPENVFTDNQAPELPSKNILVEKEIAPLRPRKEVLSKYILVEKETAPVRPRKEVLSKYDTPPRLSTASPPPHDFKPSNFTFKPSAYLENGAPLRTIFLPPDLRHQFLEIALPNTEASLETCGILCGTLISNALFISKLVIPDQESTSDTCETINEDKLFDYVDGEDLMVLGWIHTHPTQTCFMSSRDLHTHAGYQAMMPESIAIVCAPSKGDWGVFRLTDPPGMKSVLSCTKTGLFHPHDEIDIYTGALRPGHVLEAKGLEFDVVDLRKIR